MTDVAVRLADSQQDKRKCFELRYAVYIGEQQKAYAGVDHPSKTFCDDLDDEAEHVVAERRDGTVVGALRCNNMAGEIAKKHFSELFDIQVLSEVSPAQVVVCSRLVVIPACRTNLVRELLFSKIYGHALQNGVRFCLATCVPKARPLFRKYGFIEFGPPVYDEAVGELARLVLDLRDFDHLRKSGSPFLFIGQSIIGE